MIPEEKKAYSSPSLEPSSEVGQDHAGYHAGDVFGSEDDHQIQYKTLSWPLVAVLMIAEIVSNGMLSLPSSLAVVGLVPGLVVIVFLGAFGLFTAWVLIQFKLRRPEGMANFHKFGFREPAENSYSASAMDSRISNASLTLWRFVWPLG